MKEPKIDVKASRIVGELLWLDTLKEKEEANAKKDGDDK